MYNHLLFSCPFCVVLDVFFLIFKELEPDLLVWLLEGIDPFSSERKETKHHSLLKFPCLSHKMTNA